MFRVLPSDAFEQYLQLGSRRSYRLLAERFNCNKRTITTRASRERWQERLLQFQAQSREVALAKFGEDEVTIRERHLKTVRAVQGRALEALRSQQFDSAGEATKALLSAQKAERELLQLEPGRNVHNPARQTLQIERTVREVSERRIVSGGTHQN